MNISKWLYQSHGSCLLCARQVLCEACSYLFFHVTFTIALHGRCCDYPSLQMQHHGSKTQRVSRGAGKQIQVCFMSCIYTWYQWHVPKLRDEGNIPEFSKVKKQKQSSVHYSTGSVSLLKAEHINTHILIHSCAQSIPKFPARYEQKIRHILAFFFTKCLIS